MVFAIHWHESAMGVHVSPSEPPSHLPLHPTPQGHPTTPALSALSHASNLDWWSISHVIIYMFQCYSLKPSHPHLHVLFNVAKKLVEGRTSFLHQTPPSLRKGRRDGWTLDKGLLCVGAHHSGLSAPFVMAFVVAVSFTMIFFPASAALPFGVQGHNQASNSLLTPVTSGTACVQLSPGDFQPSLSALPPSPDFQKCPLWLWVAPVGSYFLRGPVCPVQVRIPYHLDYSGLFIAPLSDSFLKGGQAVLICISCYSESSYRSSLVYFLFVLQASHSLRWTVLDSWSPKKI